MAMALVDWRAVVFLVPFYYLGECLSQLNGYFEHLGGKPDVPIAWGVSTYAPLYNLTWFNNGHHAEHHYRPAVHWTRLPALRRAQCRAEAAQDCRIVRPHIMRRAEGVDRFIGDARCEQRLAQADIGFG